MSVLWPRRSPGRISGALLSHRALGLACAGDHAKEKAAAFRELRESSGQSNPPQTGGRRAGSAAR